MRIPLFPLGTVLFPGGALPLQIFEVRYLDMVQRCHREDSVFGIVGLTQGHEVQQRDPHAPDARFARETFHPVGTLARIVEFDKVQSGLVWIACRGEERFRIHHSEKLPHGLWMAEVDPLPADPPVAVPEDLEGVSQTLHRLHERLQSEHPNAVAPYPAYAPKDSVWQNAGWVANRWAELLPLPLEMKQRLLTLDSPLLRLELVGDALEQLGISG